MGSFGGRLEVRGLGGRAQRGGTGRCRIWIPRHVPFAISAQIGT